MTDIDDHDPDKGAWLRPIDLKTKPKTLGDLLREMWAQQDADYLARVHAHHRKGGLTDDDNPCVQRGYN